MMLPKLPHIKIRTVRGAKVYLSASEIKPKASALEEQYAPYPPFNSSWEVYIWQYINRQHIGWQTQVTFGGYRMKGSTRVDFLNELLGIAFYPDGLYWHSGTKKEQRDLVNRAQLYGRGFRVVQWLIVDFDQVVKDLPEFYRKMVHGT